MKRKMMMIATLALAICNIVKAEDKVTINDFKISAGETKEVSVLLNNDVAYVAFQFDLYLPKGITVQSYSADRSRMPESTTLSMSQQSDGSYRFISAAMGGEPLVGNSGGIVTLTVKAAETIESGSYTGYFRKVKLSKADATGPTYAEMPFPVTVLEPSVVTVVSCSREYGEANPTFEYTVTGGALEGTPEITCVASATSPVGTYDIVVTQGTVSNYNVTYVAGTLTVTAAPLTISAGTYTKKQGEPVPEFTLTYTGFKNNESNAVLTTQPVVSCDATEASIPGEYAVTVSGAEAQNYDISYQSGKLIVTEADPITITVTSCSRGYGDANSAFEYTVTGGTLEGTPEITCAASATSPVGIYDIVVSQGTVSNYNVTYVSGTLTVTAAPLTISAGTYKKKQGENNPEFTLTYEGFKNGETETVLTEPAVVTCDATADSPAGTYDIIVSGAKATNYEISYVNGKLIIMEITPVDESEETNFSDIIDEDTDLSDTVIDNTYYNMNTENGDGYDADEQAIVLNSTTTEEQMNAILDAGIGDDVVNENFKGIIFEVSGSGIVTVDVKTIGSHVLNVQIGKNEPTKVTMSERGTVDVKYDVNEPTYVYIYASTAEDPPAAVRRASSVAANSVLLFGYSITLTSTVITGDVNNDGFVSVADIVAVTNYMANPTGNLYPLERADVNNDGIVSVADIVTITNIMAGN